MSCKRQSRSLFARYFRGTRTKRDTLNVRANQATPDNQDSCHDRTLRTVGDASITLSVLLLLATVGTQTVQTSPLSDAAFFQMSCHDDMTLVHSFGADCSYYMVCKSGVFFTGRCPQGYIFSDFSQRCQLPGEGDKRRCSAGMLNNMPMTCMWNPTAKVPNYLSCAQYFDCAAPPSEDGGLPDYVTECPYPQLFSVATGRCEKHQYVRCVGRTEPKAPCEYLQYKQDLCQGSECDQCEARHPSCVGRSDGNHLVPGSITYFFVCQDERTINIGRCSAGYRFSNFTRRCYWEVATLPPEAQSPVTDIGSKPFPATGVLLPPNSKTNDEAKPDAGIPGENSPIWQRNIRNLLKRLTTSLKVNVYSQHNVNKYTSSDSNAHNIYHADNGHHINTGVEFKPGLGNPYSIAR